MNQQNQAVCAQPIFLYGLSPLEQGKASAAVHVSNGDTLRRKPLVSELLKSGMCHYDPLALLHSKKQLLNILGMIPVPIVLPIAGLVMMLAQIIYGETSQHP